MNKKLNHLSAMLALSGVMLAGQVQAYPYGRRVVRYPVAPVTQRVTTITVDGYPIQTTTYTTEGVYYVGAAPGRTSFVTGVLLGASVGGLYYLDYPFGPHCRPIYHRPAPRVLPPPRRVHHRSPPVYHGRGRHGGRGCR